MKLCVSVFLLCLSFFSYADFSGHWESMPGKNSFSLDIIETAGHVSGRYCFITNNGNRIDCEDDKDTNISGDIINGIAYLDFESTFGGQGKAFLNHSYGGLKLSITNSSPFISANMSVPAHLNFHKVKVE